jgi:nucleoside-diphosphate-sugar epimerase
MSTSLARRVLVVGATGYIGSRLLQVARAQGYDATGTSSDGRDGTLALDLASHDAGVPPADWRAGELVLVTAAISAPDICANDRPRAYRVNVVGSGRLIEGLLARGLRVAFFSSDTVYGERPQAFDESATTEPAGDYAAMKHELEQRFIGHPAFKSLRLSYVFSNEDKFTRYLAACAAAHRVAEIFDPFDRSVIHRDDVVAGALALATPEGWACAAQPVINFGGPATISRATYAQTLRNRVWPALRYDVVTPEPSFFINRPRRIAMQSPLLARLLGQAPRTLFEAISLEFPNAQESLHA